MCKAGKPDRPDSKDDSPLAPFRWLIPRIIGNGGSFADVMPYLIPHMTTKAGIKNGADLEIHTVPALSKLIKTVTTKPQRHTG